MCTKDCVTPDPVNPGTGALYTVETDVTFAGPGRVGFQRFFSSSNANGADMAPGWSHSYTRSITPVYAPPEAYWPGQSATVSAQYTTPSAACTQGFANIQASVSAWASASVTYNNGVCVISAASKTLGTLPIYSYPLVAAASTPFEYDLTRDDGQILRFTMQNGTVNNPPGVSLRLSVTGSGYTLTDDGDNVEVYNSAGVLQSITSRSGIVQTISYDANGLFHEAIDSFGNSVTVTRNSQGGVGFITLNGGGTVQYGYNSASQLSQVTNLDSTTRSYQYDPRFLNGLSAIVDENTTTYATWNYNDSEQVTSSQLAGGVEAASISYGSNGSATVTDALGAVRTFSYTRIADINKVIGISGSQCPTCQDSAATSYDSYGWVASRTDYNGNLTCYAKDPTRGLELVRVEGFAPGSTCPANLSTYTPQSGTVQRKISTQWNSTWREPALITEATRTTSFSYDAYGDLHIKTITDTSVTPNVARTWTYTYYSYGQVHTIDGPRTDVTDVTTYVYYNCTTGGACGQVNTITSAATANVPAGLLTTFTSYDAYGNPLAITDPNGVVTTLTYDARERMTSKQVGSEQTQYHYLPIGFMDTMTLPDSTKYTFTPDAAHRLTTITDYLGNYVRYTLDALGNRTLENWYNSSNALLRTHTRQFDTLGRLHEDINSAGSSQVTTTYTEDAQGNLTNVAAPLSRNTVNVPDALNRISQITDPNLKNSYIGYDTSDNVASVKDPLGFTTTYSHNGFNDLSQLVSPDTGTTLYTFDSGGNLYTKKDARNITGTYSYDALNRLTTEMYGDQTLQYTYDAGTYGKGHLTGVSDAYHSMSWTYDANGRVTKKTQVIVNQSVTKNVNYLYSNDDMTQLTTPSGQVIVYGYTNHRITSITVNGTTLLNNVTYSPWGAVAGWTWGNSSTVARSYTQDGDIYTINTAGDTLTFGYDYADRVDSITDAQSSGYSWGPSSGNTYMFDVLDRLTSAASTGDGSYGWTYDANGNRTAQTGSQATTFTMTPTNNQVASSTGNFASTFAYDAAGNTQSYSTLSFTYNDRGRVATYVPSGGGNTYFTYSAQGQVLERYYAGTAGYMLEYDEAGHILGEYSVPGVLSEETVWMGDIPVATLRPSGSSVAVYYVHSDQINAPRKVTRPSDNGLMWRWDPNPFGYGFPNQNPAGLGAFYYNLRLPGQMYISQGGDNDNGFRDYDVNIGRYIQSDPIGLAGGSYSTYAYVHGNPISRVDPLGLDDSICQFNPSMCNKSYGYVPPKTKDQICALLKSCNGDPQCAWKLANDIRKSNLPSSWQNLQDREVEDWLAVVGWPNGPQAQYPLITFWENIWKNLPFTKTTPSNLEALATIDDAVNNHLNDTPADLTKMCGSCGK